MSTDTSLPIARESLTALRLALEESPLIVELQLGASGHVPERLVFHRYDMLIDYLRMVARAGDTLSAWRFDESCRHDNALVRGRPLADAT